MIKAKVTVFDDETGRIYEEDKIITPAKFEVYDMEPLPKHEIHDYIFYFGETIMTSKEDN